MAGRDEGKFFIILEALNENYVYISDGKLRTEEKPKKKKLKHLVITDIVAHEVREAILSNEQISNSMIRKFLQLNDTDKEV
jgi:ribosomal protein L14E/L6E/L27E